MFFFPCPGCSYRMQSSADRVGNKVLCPKCYKQVVIPDPEVPAAYTEDTFPNEREPDLHPRAVKIMAPVNAKTTTPMPDNGGIVLFQNDTGVSPSDAMTHLTAAITMRMKPPPEPPAPDLKMSTGVWMFLTALGLVLWLATVIYQGGPLHYVTAIAVIQLSIGIGWIAYIAGRQHWIHGVLSLFPPVAIFRLFNGDGRDNHRPLRFVLTGLLFLALVYANDIAREAVRRIFGMEESQPSKLTNQAQVTIPKRLAELANNYDRGLLITELKRINNPEIVNKTSAEDRLETVAEIRKILQRQDIGDVISAALPTLVTWSGDNAKTDLREACKSQNPVTVRESLRLLANWKDAESAAILAPYLRKSDERTYVKNLLIAMGQPCETAVFETLNTPQSDSLTTIAAFTILEKVGGQKSVDFLKNYSEKGSDISMRDVAKDKAEIIMNRIKK
jgi:hypothetical protein